MTLQRRVYVYAVICVLLLVPLGTSCRSEAARIPGTPPFSSERSDPPATCIYTRWNRRSADQPHVKIILAVWPDGMVVWSDDPVEGGGPYRLAVIDPELLGQSLTRLREQGLIRKKPRCEFNIGPSSSHTAIAISCGNDRVDMRSWHELMEQNPGLVATSDGVVPLGGRDRQRVLAREPKHYRHFRDDWNAFREALTSLLPSEGEVAPDLEFELRRVDQPAASSAPATQ